MPQATPHATAPTSRKPKPTANEAQPTARGPPSVTIQRPTKSSRTPGSSAALGEAGAQRGSGSGALRGRAESATNRSLPRLAHDMTSMRHGVSVAARGPRPLRALSSPSVGRAATPRVRSPRRGPTLPECRYRTRSHPRRSTCHWSLDAADRRMSARRCATLQSAPRVQQVRHSAVGRVGWSVG